MNVANELAKQGILDRFLGRMGVGQGMKVDILQNPTEEIIYDISRGRSPVMHGYLHGKKKKTKLIRKEENYLWSTRRFPSNTANNTIGSGAVAAGDYDFFGNGVGDSGNTMGYFSLTNLTNMQTNMDKGGKIPTGKGYMMYELAVSFNSSAPPSDIIQLVDSMSLRYEKQGGQLVVYHGPIRNWPGGVGITGYASTTAATTTIERGTQGTASLQNIRRFKNPRVLNANDTFKYTIAATAVTPMLNAAIALSTFVEVSIFLWGYHFDRIPV